MDNFKERVRSELALILESNPDVLAMWEAGSAAHGTSDAYSDIDLVIVARESIENAFAVIEERLERLFGISHRYIEPKCFWPGCYQRVYFLEGAPKHFFLDVAVFLESSKDVLTEFMRPERHGRPVVHFDKQNLVNACPSDPAALESQQLKRLMEIEAAYPVFKLEVFKELDRGHSIDAFGFYYGGVIRPLIELMGILYRPFRYDFGLRYLHQTFPEGARISIERLLYVGNAGDLGERMKEADQLFMQVSRRIREKLQR